MPEQSAQPKVEHLTTSDAQNKPVKHVHHGRTPAAWAGSILAMVGFLVGGIGMVLEGGVGLFFWIGAVILAVALIVTVVLQKTGHGAN